MRKAFCTAIAVILSYGIAAAHQFEKGDLRIGHPWTRVTPAGATVGAGYLTINNKGKGADRLIGGTFDGAASVEVHQMSMDGDKMLMRHLKDGLEVKPGATVTLNPGGYHLMFMGLTKPIAEGANIKGSLTFEKAGTVDIEFKVEPLGATSSSDAAGSEMKMNDGMDMQKH